MPGDERDSPRAAIRSWLDGTGTKSPKSRQTQAYVQQEQHQHGRKARQHSIRRNSKRKGTGLERTATFGIQGVDRHGKENRSRHKYNGEEPEHRATESITAKADEIPTHRHGERHTRQRPDEPGLAERLGLHAPFRTFRDRSVGDDIDLDVLSRPRKRRRRRSSTGSYLEPAEIQEQTDVESDAGIPPQDAEVGKGRQLHPENRPDHLSESSVVASPILEKPAESYVRRPRHKTREDRYELNEGENSRRKKKPKSKDMDGKDKKHKKHKRKEKSGAALMHNFSAQNVAHDRLTLQPAKALGLFGRGKASSPIRRQGLPDLAFSEVSFLNSHRPERAGLAKPSDTRPAEKSTRRKSTKPADTEAEISRYFTSTKAPGHNLSDHQDKPKLRDSGRVSRSRNSPPDFIDLPGTPFLGFGSCGAGSVSPAKRLASPSLRGLERRLTRSPTRSTSYLTWSQSGALSQVPSRLEKHKVSPLESSRLLNLKARSPRSREAAPSPLAISSSHVEKNSFEKQRTTVSLTPERNVRSSSSHCKSRSPQLEAKDSNKPEPHSEHDPQRSVKDKSQRRQAHGSPDLHNGNSAFPPDADTMANRHEPNVTAMAIPQPASSGVGEVVNPLDVTLEALLHDARSVDREVVKISLRMSESVPNHTDHVGGSTAARTRHHLRHSPPGHSAVSYAGSASKLGYSIPAAEPHIEYDIPYPRPGHESELPRTRGSTQVTPRPSRNSSSRPNAEIYTPNVPQSPNSRRMDSRSAWNGYGEIYERQQREIPTAIDHHQHLGDHSDENEGEYVTPYVHLPPSLQQPAEYHDDYTGSGLYEGNGMLRVANANFEEEAYLDDDAWGDTEENLFTEHDAPFPAEIPAHGYENHCHIHDTFQEPQYRTEPATVTRRPDTSHYMVPSIGKAFVKNPTNISHNLEETAPSGFWTPHRLY